MPGGTVVLITNKIVRLLVQEVCIRTVYFYCWTKTIRAEQAFAKDNGWNLHQGVVGRADVPLLLVDALCFRLYLARVVVLVSRLAIGQPFRCFGETK